MGFKKGCGKGSGDDKGLSLGLWNLKGRAGRERTKGGRRDGEWEGEGGWVSE